MPDCAATWAEQGLRDLGTCGLGSVRFHWTIFVFSPLMPELPEVEVTRLSFAERIANARIVRVHLGKPLRWPLGCDGSDLHGQIVVAVRRRGKYL